MHTIQIENFRKLKIYQNALRFTNWVLQWIEQNIEKIGVKKYQRIREEAIQIPKVIATALSNIHMRIKYRKLKQSKKAFQTVQKYIKTYGMGKEIELISSELLKSFNEALVT